MKQAVLSRAVKKLQGERRLECEQLFSVGPGCSVGRSLIVSRAQIGYNGGHSLCKSLMFKNLISLCTQYSFSFSL